MNEINANNLTRFILALVGATMIQGKIILALVGGSEKRKRENLRLFGTFGCETVN